jgi:phosphohistidine phosphatase
MLRLALLRHAKSSWDDRMLDDFDRPLNERGRAAAPLMGRLLASLNFSPDTVLCSPAQRARETLELVLPHLTTAPKSIYFVNELYLASAEGILRCLRAADGPAAKMLVVGHNPGMQVFACQLASSGDAAEVKRLCEKFPTGGLALYSFPQETFAALDPKTGHLETFLTPKDRR